MPRVCGCVGVVRSTPVAQTQVLRRVLTGGISTNSGRVFFRGTQYGHFVPFGGRASWNGAAGVTGGLVFGTLLGPETTGPWHGFPVFPYGGAAGAVVWDLCFWFPGCTDRMVASLFLGVVCVGCVVRGCCLRTT